MKNRTVNCLLLAGTIVPLILIFWPFARWGDAMGLILRVIPSLCAQALLCRVGTHPLIRAIPMILTGLAALWGTYLFFTSPAWSNATFGGLIADYVSPFICCAIVSVIHAKKASPK